MTTFLYVIAVYLLLLLCITTFRLIKYDGYGKTQKVIQLFIIWIIPIIGVVIVAHFIDDEIKISKNSTYVPRRLLSLFYLSFMVSYSIDSISNNDDYTYAAYESSGGGSGGEL